MLNVSQLLHFGEAAIKKNLISNVDFKLFFKGSNTIILCYSKEAVKLISELKMNEGELK